MLPASRKHSCLLSHVNFSGEVCGTTVVKNSLLGEQKMRNVLFNSSLLSFFSQNSSHSTLNLRPFRVLWGLSELLWFVWVRWCHCYQLAHNRGFWWWDDGGGSPILVSVHLRRCIFWSSSPNKVTHLHPSNSTPR